MNTETITDITDFLLHLDQLKLVNRRTYINAGERIENSAEHSWHLAMACWNFALILDDDYNIPILIQMALIHDLGEIGAGDTFLYSNQRENAHIKERESVAQTASHPGNAIHQIAPLWEAQESGDSKEARLLKVVDRLLPFLHNINSEGKAWQDNNIKQSQVLQMHAFIEHEQPAIHAWFLTKLNEAVNKGWLKAG